MKCVRCSEEAPADAGFCPECGSKLPMLCPDCDTLNAPDHKFCKSCGRPLTGANRTTPDAERLISPAPSNYTPKYLAEKILSSRHALEGERKQITVLFADLKSSMELLAGRDPEEARKLLDPVLNHMMEAVHHYEGTVNQVMGDGIMALFGAPLAHEDHAVRGCYAALRIQESVKRYAEGVRQSHDVPVRVRVGLNSGEVVVRSIGSDLRMDYTAVGQTTHLAARMEQMATPGSILIASDVFRAVEGYVEARPLGRVEVKGLNAPVEVYELTDAATVRTRLQAAATRGLTRFTGRDVEMAGLHQALELAGTGRGQLVAVVGEPGVGKSRLLHEVIRSDRTRGWLVLESGSVPYGRATPYLPFIELLRSYFRIDSRDDHHQIRERVVAKLSSLGRASTPTLPALLALLDVPVEDPKWKESDPSQRRRLTLEALKRLFLRESQAQPLLLVFEDLHGIDSETQAVLEFLVDSLVTASMLILASYRPEYQHRWGNKSYYKQLWIDPLPSTSTETLLEALLGDQPPLRPLKDVLIERAGGNPFFLEESVRTLVETGVIAGERGAYRLTKEPQGVRVPSTVQAVLAARIDRLAAEDKRLLQIAAVVGKDVPFSLLQAIEPESEDALHGGLSRLQAAEFLYETRRFPELEYTFKHGLTQEVAYGALLHERRRALHARVVEAIERLAGSRLAEQVDRLAHHALHGELWAKAVTYLHQAGLKATARSASREAVTCVERALVALGRLPENRETTEKSIDLRFDLHSALIPLGEVDRIFEVLREAEKLAQALGDQRRLGRVSASMASCFWWIGEPDSAVECGQRAFAIASALGDDALEALANHRVGEAYVLLGEHRKAIASFRRNLEMPKGEPARERFGMGGLGSVTSRAWMAWCLANLGEFAAGIAVAEEGIRVAEEANHPYSLATTHSGAGQRQVMQGNLIDAIAALERSVEICQRGNFAPLYLLTAANLGFAYALSGRLPEGLALLEGVAKRSAALKIVPTHTLVLTFLGEVQLLSGHIEEARKSAQDALAMSRAHRQRYAEPEILRLLGDLRAAQDPPELESAATLYREALALATELELRPLVARCHLQLARLGGKSLPREEAGAHLTAALDMFHDMGMSFWLTKARVAKEELRG